MTNAGCPPDVLEWIPLYAGDRLSEEARRRVAAHTAECRECRDDLELALNGPPLSGRTPTAEDERVLARVLERIDAVEGSPVRPRIAAPKRPGATAVRRPRVRAALALAASLVLGLLAGFAADRAVGAAEPAYRTAAAGVRGDGTNEIDIVLRDDVAIGQVRQALVSANAQIVSGPSPLGRYRLRLPADADAEAVARRLRATEGGVASFAEPLRR